MIVGKNIHSIIELTEREAQLLAYLLKLVEDLTANAEKPLMNTAAARLCTERKSSHV